MKKCRTPGHDRDHHLGLPHCSLSFCTPSATLAGSRAGLDPQCLSPAMAQDLAWPGSCWGAPDHPGSSHVAMYPGEHEKRLCHSLYVPVRISLHTGQLLSPQTSAVPSGERRTCRTRSKLHTEKSSSQSSTYLLSRHPTSPTTDSTTRQLKTTKVCVNFFSLLSKWPACPARMRVTLPCLQDHFRIRSLLYSKSPVNLFPGYGYLGREMSKHRHQLGRLGFWQVHFATIPEQPLGCHHHQDGQALLLKRSAFRKVNSLLLHAAKANNFFCELKALPRWVSRKQELLPLLLLILVSAC